MIGERTTQKKPRRLRFNSMQEILQEIECIFNANRVEHLGNWTAGQVFEHLAKSFNSSYQPSQAILPAWRRVIAKVCKPFMLRFGLPSGVQISYISDVAAQEFLPGDQVSLSEGYHAIKSAIRSVSSQEMTAKHNCFGKMSPQDWERMHCRHAELHLRLLIPLGSVDA